MMFGTVRAARPEEHVVQNVTVSQSSFNPSIGQLVGISFELAEAGSVDVVVVGQSGTVRAIAHQQQLPAGRQAFSWNGRADAGAIVPNDAYWLRIGWISGARRDTFDPTPSAFSKPIELQPPNYDVSGGLFSYTLPSASRVVLRATCLSPSPTVAFVKTIVAGEPRTAGSVVDVWNGFDETGKIFMPNQAGFNVTLEVRALPAPAIIAFGNRKGTPQSPLGVGPARLPDGQDERLGR